MSIDERIFKNKEGQRGGTTLRKQLQEANATIQLLQAQLGKTKRQRDLRELQRMILLDTVQWYGEHLGHKTRCTNINHCFTCRAQKLAVDQIDKCNDLYKRNIRAI